MKKIYLYSIIASFALHIFSCSNPKGESTGEESSENEETNEKPTGPKIQISGTILNPIKGAVSLEIMTAPNQFSLVKPIELEGDKFRLEVNIPEPDFYRINLFDKQYIYLVLNNENVKIEADASQEEVPYSVKGSKDTDFFQTVNRMQNNLKIKNDSLAKLAEEGQDREELIAVFTGYQEQYAKELSKLIDNSEPSVAMFMALSTVDASQYFSIWESTSKILEKNYPNSKYTKSLVLNVEQTKAKLKKAENTAVGKLAPEIELQTPEGKAVKLSSVKGKYILIDFWASWCRPCRAENPNVVAVYEKYKDKGLEVYGVSLDRNADAWKQAIKQDKLTWTQVWDANNQTAQEYSVDAIPQNFLIDKEGKIVAKNLRGSQLEAKVAELLN